MPSSRRTSPERDEAADEENDQAPRIPTNRSQFSASSSFFIIHESTNVIVPKGGPNNPSKQRDESRTCTLNRTRALSSSSKKKKLRLKTPSSAPNGHSATSATLRTSTSPIVYESHQEEQNNIVPMPPISNTETQTLQATAKQELSILNRCGSAPDLPMYSPLSANVYSSFKKRSYQSTNGTSPHLATLQRCRLTPLPVNTRPDTDKSGQEPHTLTEELEPLHLYSKDPLLPERVRSDTHTIASLKQRLVVVEREISSSTKYRYKSDKQIVQLSLENQRLQAEKNQQQARIDELERTTLRQRHEYDKLAARYASVYANIHKLVDQQNSSDRSGQQSALQVLARENQDFLRKLRVLEARHAEDKTLTSTQEKKIKRLKAEIEALQHMQDAKTREEDLDDAISDNDQVSRLGKPKRRVDNENSHGGRPGSASSSVSITASTPRRVGAQHVQTSVLGTSSHLVTAESYQYIDPNILKVLEKVDSQFSITNAINLSIVLKKWLNSCVHVVCSTHIPTVLQTLLKRTCELLHCEHAALFTVDHAARKLVATCSERSTDRWELPLDKGIAGYAARHNLLCNVHCANDDPRFYSSTDSITGTISREVLALPIVHELQLSLDSHLVGSNRPKTTNLGVFAVLRAWNTTHQKPFSANDQILGTLLAIQAGILLRQSAVTKTLEKINHKTHQILQMPAEIVAKASSALHFHSPSSDLATSQSINPRSLTPSVVRLVDAAQKTLGECLDIKQIRIFILDVTVQQLWHVEVSDLDGDGVSSVVRRYVNANASLCALLLREDTNPMVVSEPTSEAAYNDTVDIAGGARGLYLVPILSPWGNEAPPFGMLQVARVAKARLSASPFALTKSERIGIVGSAADNAVTNEREAAQQTEDKLMLELLELFCRVFAGLLHHVVGQQLYDDCPQEILEAQLATLRNHLDGLAVRRQLEDEEENDSSRLTSNSTNSRQSGRHASVLTIASSTPLVHNTRRVASANDKHRAKLDSRRVSSSPTRNSSQLRTRIDGVEADNGDLNSQTTENKDHTISLAISHVPDDVLDLMASEDRATEKTILELKSGTEDPAMQQSEEHSIQTSTLLSEDTIPSHSTVATADLIVNDGIIPPYNEEEVPNDLVC